MTLKKTSLQNSSKRMTLTKRLSLFVVLVLVLTSLVACKTNPINQPVKNYGSVGSVTTGKDGEEMPNEPNQTNQDTIRLLSSGYSFVDGVANISYEENNIEYQGIINAKGEIIYSTMRNKEKWVSFTHIGKGATFVEQWKRQNDRDVIELCYIVDIDGNTVATLESNMEILASGDGLALMYQKKSSVTNIEHLYGVIDFSGKWVQPLTDLGRNGSGYYAGDGFFAISVWENIYNVNGCIFFNSNTGKKYYISKLNGRLSTFVNGITFVNNQEGGKIVNPYNQNTDTQGIEIPRFCLLYSDGTFKEYSMENKEYRGYSNGYLWYTVKGDENNVYIENLTSSNESTFVYNKYPANMIMSIDFDGDYGLVRINGAEGRFFTLIDKNGNQQFEPVEISYSIISGKDDLMFSDETIVFRNPDNQYCIADKKGNIIITEYSYLERFSDGWANAYITDKMSYESSYFYVNKNGERLIIKKQ